MIGIIRGAEYGCESEASGPGIFHASCMAQCRVCATVKDLPDYVKRADHHLQAGAPTQVI